MSVRVAGRECGPRREDYMSDSSGRIGQCRHASDPAWCVECLQAEVERLRKAVELAKRWCECNRREDTKLYKMACAALADRGE